MISRSRSSPALTTPITPTPSISGTNMPKASGRCVSSSPACQAERLAALRSDVDAYHRQYETKPGCT